LAERPKYQTPAAIKIIATPATATNFILPVGDGPTPNFGASISPDLRLVSVAGSLPSGCAADDSPIVPDEPDEVV
jgi:hypothetical protein